MLATYRFAPEQRYHFRVSMVGRGYILLTRFRSFTPICRSRIRQTMVQPSSGQQYLVSYHHDHPVEICISQGHALLEIRLLLPAANAQESAECATTRKFQKTVSCQRVLLIISGVYCYYRLSCVLLCKNSVNRTEMRMLVVSEWVVYHIFYENERRPDLLSSTEEEQLTCISTTKKFFHQCELWEVDNPRVVVE